MMETSKGKTIGIITGSIVAVIVALTVGFLVYRNSPSVRLNNALMLGQRYLQELNYEQAVVEFSLAIEIDPTNVEAYLGLAEAYVFLGDIAKAIEILQNGYDTTGDETLKTRLDELSSELSGAQFEENKDKWVAALVGIPPYYSFGKGPFISREEYREKMEGYASILEEIDEYMTEKQIDHLDIPGLDEMMSWSYQIREALNDYYLSVGRLNDAKIIWEKRRDGGYVESDTSKYEYDNYGRSIKDTYTGSMSGKDGSTINHKGMVLYSYIDEYNLPSVEEQYSDNGLYSRVVHYYYDDDGKLIRSDESTIDQLSGWGSTEMYHEYSYETDVIVEHVTETGQDGRIELIGDVSITDDLGHSFGTQLQVVE
ncbi:MAG: tetratricopeptide repeat protein [Butyrivibrio sp.]|nr:tetratricopeptide repeat protein [Butyrivibrio sp.]